MKSSSILLSILGLIAGALGINNSASDYHVTAAKHANRVAKFKKENDLSDQEDEALGAVLRAAETAPVSADASRASSLFADDTVPGTKPLGDTVPGADGADGISGHVGDPGPSESAQDLVEGNTKEELLALAESEGVDVNASSNKDEIAQAIVDGRNAK